MNCHMYGHKLPVASIMDLLCLSSLAGSATAGMDSDKLQTVKSECSYYHYCCDGIDDRVQN